MQTVARLLAGLTTDEALARTGALTPTSIHDDSRRVLPGGLFVALRGVKADGAGFIADAVARGAAIIVAETPPPTDALGPAVFLPVADARQAIALVAARWHGLDSASQAALASTPAGSAAAAAGALRLRLAGVTGTNGKSTSAFMTAAILRAAGWKTGLLGTVQYDLCGRTVAAAMTTPGPLELCGYLRECADHGAHAAVMEVSSHALDQKRTDGLRFDAAAFTNLTGDHLDYHQTMENYAAAKARLFEGLAPDAVAIFNRDDAHAARMARDCRARRLTFSLRPGADLTATISRTTVEGTLYRLRIGTEEAQLENALVGPHNVYNALTAAGLAHALGAPFDAIVAGLSGLRNVPGRLQRVVNSLGIDVFVDYAHTDDALRNVLSVLRPLTARRLICVFGCGGDRDRSKRPRMARVAGELSHAVIVTSDNPRSEEPQAIMAEIMTGFEPAMRRRVLVEPDRAAAIKLALAAATAGDIVLIAGKGHEDYQIIGGDKLHFDDVEAAARAAAELARPAAAAVGAK